jgi:hypothetical protein
MVAMMIRLVQLHQTGQHFASIGGGDDDAPEAVPFRPSPAQRDELPYRVELWDQARNSVEQVLAVASNGTIGYAAYYAATRDHPQRYITLRHNNRIVSRWNGPGH